MAKLANCPACSSDVLLPEASATEAAVGESWGECPTCGEQFSLASAHVRTVPELKLVPGSEAQQTSTHADESQDAVSQSDAPPDDQRNFNKPTLGSFLDRSTDVDSSAAAEDAPAESRQSPTPPTLAEFQGLDDLLRHQSPDAGESDPPATSTTAANEGSAADSDSPGDKVDEVTPLADRWRASWNEELPSDPTTADTADRDEREDDVKNTAEQPQPEPSATDDSNFDFDVPDAGASPKSLRESMGFAGSMPLEVDESPGEPDFSNLEGDTTSAVAADEVNISPPDVRPGMVATRRRSGVGSMVRSLVGIVGGGVLGIAAGYLLLLWIFYFLGRTDEPLGLAKYYPDVIKPNTFREASSEPLAAGTSEAPSESADDPARQRGTGGVETANFEAELPAAAEEDASGPARLSPDMAARAMDSMVVAGAPQYTVDDVEQLTATAEQSKEGLLAGSLEDDTARPVKGASYAKIAKLADALTFAPDGATDQQRRVARGLFPSLFEAPQHRQEVSLIAGYWLMSEKRTHGGIFFSGKPTTSRQAGRVAEYGFVLPTGQEMVVLTDQALSESLASADTLVVVGSVVDNPAESIDGYEGSATQAIWSQTIMQLDGEAR